MTFTLAELVSDIASLDIKDIYEKYILCNENWYFENVLTIQTTRIPDTEAKFKKIISASLDVQPEDILLVGSAKIGYSLAPPVANNNPKLFKAFCADGIERKASDLDIAIISETLFNKYWKIFRESFQIRYKAIYDHVPVAIYRGYIDERNLLEVSGCRKNWQPVAAVSKKMLHADLFVKHDINYRIYRNWYDFEQYHLQALRKIKRGVS